MSLIYSSIHPIIIYHIHPSPIHQPTHQSNYPFILLSIQPSTNCQSIHPFLINLSTYPATHPPTYPLTHSSIYSPIYPHTYPPTTSLLTNSFIYPSIYIHVPTPNPSRCLLPTYQSIHQYIYPPINPFTNTFIHPPILSSRKYLLVLVYAGCCSRCWGFSKDKTNI